MCISENNSSCGTQKSQTPLHKTVFRIFNDYEVIKENTFALPNLCIKCLSILFLGEVLGTGKLSPCYCQQFFFPFITPSDLYFLVSNGDVHNKQKRFSDGISYNSAFMDRLWGLIGHDLWGSRIKSCISRWHINISTMYILTKSIVCQSRILILNFPSVRAAVSFSR